MAMKYFTQDLIVRGQSHNEKELNAVETLWDESCARYSAYLDSIRHRLPPGLRQRIDSYYLHDAVVRGMGRKGNSLVIILQLDAPPQSIITFTYDLLSEPHIHKETLPAELCAGSIVDWEYDEIEMVPGDPPGWRQSVLFTTLLVDPVGQLALRSYVPGGNRQEEHSRLRPSHFTSAVSNLTSPRERVLSEDN